MRVLMTADAVGGVWTYAMELARALRPYGVRVTLAVMGPAPASDQRAEAARQPNLDVRTRSFKLEWMPDPWEDVRKAGEWLLALEREVEPDVVHVNGYAHGALPWRAPVLVAGHSCVLSWWEAVHGEAAPREWDRYRREVTRGIVSADLLVTPTRFMLDRLDAHYGLPAETRVIPNARDPTLFPSAEKESFVFAAGRPWDEAKNFTTLDAAAAGVEWPVLIAGDPSGGDGNGPNAKLAHARVLGRLSAARLARRYAQAAVFAHPARYEPFGLAPLEAAHAGCALVLGDVPSLREVWGDAALYAPPDDADALADALARLAGDAKLREVQALAARERAARYVPETMGAAYLDAYRVLAPEAVAALEDDTPCAS